MNAMEMIAKCARCLAGLCAHQGCTTPGFGMDAETQVAGTSCCGDCAPVLLEMVLHPPTTVVVNPPVKIGGGGGSGASFGPRTHIGGGAGA